MSVPIGTLVLESGMNIGFTGTRRGMTEHQMAAFSQLMSEVFQLSSFHHGDCVGADDEAANIMSEIRSYSDMDTRNWKIVCHPPVDESHRAFNTHHDEAMGPRTHFARNREIVDACDMLVVVPMDTERQDRGGTWYTHDYAVKKNKKVVIIWPDGRVES